MSDYRSRWWNDDDYRRDERDRERWRTEGRDERDYGSGRERQGRYENEYTVSSRKPGQERDYGRDMLDDMRRYARGGYGSGRESSDWERSGSRSPSYVGTYEGEDYGRSDYGRSDYGRSDYGRSDYGRGGREERGFLERAGDEVASWFGDDDAERRRRQDAERGESGARHHRGRGPRGYTRSDDRIREDVNDRLTDDAYVDASDIEVTVSNCEVTLNGSVDGRSAKRRAEDIAESVSGVRHVQNNLRVQQSSYTGGGTSAGASAMAGLGTGGMTGTTGTSGTRTTSGQTSGGTSTSGPVTSGTSTSGTTTTR